MAIIDKPSDYFNTKLYSGNSSTQSITGVGFQPDFVWIKKRSATAYHYLMDSIRGTGKQLYSNVTNAEETNVNALTSYDSDGFSLGSEGDVNASSTTYASWNWKAGGTASSNTSGSITSNVSASTTSGFSIVSYTGTGSAATIGHGLGVAPKFMIVKTIDAARDWTVYHGGISNMASGYIILNATDAFSTAFSTIWNNTDPTSSVFSVGTANTSNNLNSNYIAYCFAEKQGFSKFGSYEGNNTTDNAFIYTGFKPAWVMVKNVDAAYGWQILDNKRNTYNPADDSLFANLINAEDVTTGDDIDFLSNGFKVREGGNSVGDNYTYIYMAFAENPLVGTNNIPATAR